MFENEESMEEVGPTLYFTHCSLTAVPALRHETPIRMRGAALGKVP